MSLARRQADLVVALVTGGATPAGFDAARVTAAREQLMRKRAGEVAAAWPALSASFGTRWYAEFSAWASGRPPRGSLRDGWDFARSQSSLDALARAELAAREAGWRYDGTSPRRRSAVSRALVMIGARFSSS